MKIKLNEKKVIEKYQKGETLKSVGKEFGVSDKTIMRILIKNNIKRRVTLYQRGHKSLNTGRTHFKKGCISGNYKGGIHKDSSGYFLKLVKNHPYCNKSGYFPIYRLKMEEKLGRYLNPEERVHHIDFDKSNNHIDNLHLFSSESEHQKYHSFLKNCVREAIEIETR